MTNVPFTLHFMNMKRLAVFLLLASLFAFSFEAGAQPRKLPPFRIMQANGKVFNARQPCCLLGATGAAERGGEKAATAEIGNHIDLRFFIHPVFKKYKCSISRNIPVH
jgi:hypothetical protein